MSVFPASRFRSFIIVVVFAALALASGCSSVRLAYATAPDLAYWWLDRYADFNDPQKPRAREAIERWFAWHRRTQLPDYATLLAQAQREVLADTTAARVCEWQDNLVQRLRTAFDRATPAAATLISTLAPEQISSIERRYAKINRQYRDDFLQPDPRKRAAAALERTVDRVESLYGRLDEPQRARIAATLKRSPFDPELWLVERRERQQDALRVLRTLSAARLDPDRAHAELRAYEQRIERSPREAYRQYSASLKEFNCAFAAEVHNGASAEQRRTAADRLAGWEEDLRSLAASADAD